MKKAFTLIELLIVVAIIAILAAIAVPNFLEAQTRAKVSRAKSDMRTLATGLESYSVDYNTYPQCNIRATALAYGPYTGDSDQMATSPVLERITTPIAFLSTASFRDAFSVKYRKSAGTGGALASLSPDPLPEDDAAKLLNTYLYQAVSKNGRAQVATDSFTPDIYKGTGYFVFSVGPDQTFPNLGGVLAVHLADATGLDNTIQLVYDPTNGTVSNGSIFRTGGVTSGGPNYAAGEGLAAAINRANN